ncbi:MAG: hypothetical protein AAF127_09700 [Pseudomonadota bacterium]
MTTVIDPEWFEGMATKGWQKRWMDNFVENMGGGLTKEDLVNDGWTEIPRRIRERMLSGTPMWVARMATGLAKALKRDPSQRKPAWLWMASSMKLIALFMPQALNSE